MPDNPIPGGYIWHSEVKRAMNANRRARHDIARIAQMVGSNSEMNRYLTRIILALAEEQDALSRLKDISNGRKE